MDTLTNIKYYAAFVVQLLNEIPSNSFPYFSATLFPERFKNVFNKFCIGSNLNEQYFSFDVAYRN